MTEQCALHTVIEGRVQGVGFRYFVQEKATRLNLNGWVRNTYDEKVEVWAEGERENLETLLGFLRRGPRSAFVSNLKQSWEEPGGKYQRFSVLPTV